MRTKKNGEMVVANVGSEPPSDMLVLRTASELIARSRIASGLGMSFNGKRDLYEALGYSKNLSFDDFWLMFRRGRLGKRVVAAPVESTWRGNILVQEDDKPDETAFEKAWKELNKKFRVIMKLARADKLSRLGEFGVLLMGFSDGLELDQPVVGTNLQLIYLQPYGQGSITIQEWELDTKNSRYGLPKIYNLSIRVVGAASNVPVFKTTRVHYTRVIHIAEGLLDNEVYGCSCLESCYNAMMDLEKVAGGSAETYWQGALGGKAFTAKDGATLGTEDRKAMQTEIDEYTHNLRRYLRLQNIDVQDLTPQVSDPTQSISAQLDIISGDTGIPKRILIGSERGELASTQDESNWLNRVGERRAQYAEPDILCAFIDRMISVGALPAPGSGKYQIVWPDLWASSEKEKAEGAKTKSEALAAYLNAPGADQIIPIEFFLRDFLGLSQEQVDQIKKMLPEGDFPEPQEEPISGEEQPGGEEAGKKLQGVVGNLNSNAGNGHAGHGGAHAGHSGGNPNHDPSTGRFSAGAAATARIRELASAQLTHEELSTYDARGHLIRTIRGTEESVSANDMSGVHTAIHNHPGGDSFSSADIRTAFDNGISRAIVVGQQHVYIATELNLKRGNKLPYKKYTDDLRKTENKYMTQMAKDVKAGMSQDAALLEYRHNIWTEMSQKGYLKYERIPISQITANFNPNHDAHSGEFTSGAGGSAADEAARATAKGRGYTVPPAWKNVWVNPDPHADLQVTGFDSKGRKQYIYSATAANRNSAAKFARIKNFTNDYDGIMNRIKGDMVHGAHSEEARVLYLISQTGFRVGGASDTGADKQAFGATTLLKSHVTVEGNKTTFNFVGKKGVVQNHTIEDPVIAGMFKGKRDGRLFNTTDAKVRDYLHSITPHYKVKDFRTYVATGTALQVMATMSKPSSKSAYDKAVKQVSTVVSQKLGNTPAMAKGSYIDPAVWGSWSKVINR